MQSDGSQDRLSRDGPDPLVTAAIVLWMLYSVSGFRIPTTPITLSDSNGGSAIRQLLFAASGGLAIRRLMSAGALSRAAQVRVVEVCLFMLLAGSALWSDFPGLTIKRSLVFMFGLVTLITATHMTKRPVALMQLIVFYFTAGVAWASLAGWVALPRNCVENPARPGLAGIAGHPNTLAPFVALGFVLSLGVRHSLGRGLLVRFGQAGQLIATVMTGSMTTLSMLVVCVGVYVYLVIDRYRRGTIHVVAAILGAYIFVVGPTQAKGDVLAAMGRDASLSGRGELWAKIGEQIAQRPVFGCGYGAFWTEGKGRALVTTWNPRQSHHAYLDVLTDVGIVGLIFVLLVFPIRTMVSWFHIAGERRTNQRSAAASMTALAFGVMFSYGFAQSFYFKMDSIAFFLLTWCVLLLTNRTHNGMNAEFTQPRVLRPTLSR